MPKPDTNAMPCELRHLTPDQFSGKEKIGGSLYLSGLTSIPDRSPQLKIVAGMLRNRDAARRERGGRAGAGGQLDAQQR